MFFVFRRLLVSCVELEVFCFFDIWVPQLIMLMMFILSDTAWSSSIFKSQTPSLSVGLKNRRQSPANFGSKSGTLSQNFSLKSSSRRRAVMASWDEVRCTFFLRTWVLLNFSWAFKVFWSIFLFDFSNLLNFWVSEVWISAMRRVSACWILVLVMEKSP